MRDLREVAHKFRHVIAPQKEVWIYFLVTIRFNIEQMLHVKMFRDQDCYYVIGIYGDLFYYVW